VNAGIHNFVEGLLEVEGGGGAIADFGHGGYQKMIAKISMRLRIIDLSGFYWDLLQMTNHHRCDHLKFQSFVQDGAFFAGEVEPEALAFARVFFVFDRGTH
jgi:hypothetical protein